MEAWEVHVPGVVPAQGGSHWHWQFAVDFHVHRWLKQLANIRLEVSRLFRQTS